MPVGHLTAVSGTRGVLYVPGATASGAVREGAAVAVIYTGGQTRVVECSAASNPEGFQGFARYRCGRQQPRRDHHDSWIFGNSHFGRRWCVDSRVFIVPFRDKRGGFPHSPCQWVCHSCRRGDLSLRVELHHGCSRSPSVRVGGSWVLCSTHTP